LFFSTAFLLPPSALTWAAHPFVTDDTGTQGTGNWQLEVQADFNRHEFTTQTAAGPVQQKRRVDVLTSVLTYGLLENLDLALGLNHLRQHITENGAVTDDVSGRADSTLELKWRFHESSGLSLALKPALLLPTGDETRGLGTGKLSYGVNAIATYEMEPWTFNLNLAYTRLRFKQPQDAAEVHEHLRRLSAGAAYAVRGNFKLVGELGARSNESRDDPFLPGRNGHFAMLGLIYSLTDKIDLDAGYRRSLNHAELDRGFLAGATFRW